MRSLFLSLLLIPALSYSQSVSISPSSINLIGNITDMTEFSVSYKNITLHYFYARDQNACCIFEGEYEFFGYSQSTPALSYEVSFLKNIFKVGPMVSYRRFPIEGGTRFNVFIDIGFSFHRFRLSFKHISNGFALIHHPNPGFDTISVRYSF